MINTLDIMYEYGIYSDYTLSVFSLIAGEKDIEKGNLLWEIVEKNIHVPEFTISEVITLFEEIKQLDYLKNKGLKELFTSSNIELTFKQKKKVATSILDADSIVVQNVINRSLKMTDEDDVKYVLTLLKCKNVYVLNAAEELDSKPFSNRSDVKVVANAVGTRQAYNASGVLDDLNNSSISRKSDFYKIPVIVANQEDVGRSDAMRNVCKAFGGYIGTFNIIKYMNKCKNDDFVYAIGNLAMTLGARKIERLIALYKKKPTNIKLQNVEAVKIFVSVLNEEDMLNILSSNYDYVLFSTLYDEGNRVEAVNGLHLLDKFFKKKFIDLDIEVNPEKCYVPYIKRD